MLTELATMVLVRALPAFLLAEEIARLLPPGEGGAGACGPDAVA